MPTGTHSESFQVGSVVFNRTVSASADNANTYGDAASPIALAAGLTVTSWVKSTSLTGTCNLPAGHGYGTSGVFDVYGSDGTLYAYGVVGSIATNALTFSSGGTSVNDGFPSSETAGMIVCKQQQVNVDIDGDNASLVGIQSTVIGHADFQDSSSNSIRALSLSANEADCWDSDKAVNPYTGAVVSKVLVSNGTTTAGILQIAVLQDATP